MNDFIKLRTSQRQNVQSQFQNLNNGVEGTYPQNGFLFQENQNLLAPPTSFIPQGVFCQMMFQTNEGSSSVPGVFIPYQHIIPMIPVVNQVDKIDENAWSEENIIKDSLVQHEEGNAKRKETPENNSFDKTGLNYKELFAQRKSSKNDKIEEEKQTSLIIKFTNENSSIINLDSENDPNSEGKETVAHWKEDSQQFIAFPKEDPVIIEEKSMEIPEEKENIIAIKLNKKDQNYTSFKNFWPNINVNMTGNKWDDLKEVKNLLSQEHNATSMEQINTCQDKIFVIQNEKYEQNSLSQNQKEILKVMNQNKNGEISTQNYNEEEKML